MKEKLIRFLKDEDGIETIEYALIAALIAVASIVMAKLLGTEVNNVFNTVATELQNAQQ